SYLLRKLKMMEGPLSKWTNMVHGWQYRWFRLEEDVLLYYTSREKMLKGQQRGCMRLHGAVVGIDGENNSLFTITVDGKVFHLQGRDEKERNHWVRALEGVIRDCGGYRKTPKNKESAPEALKRKIAEADQHLADIILQVKGLESLKEHASEKERKNVEDLIASSSKLLDTVKHAIILLQLVDKYAFPDVSDGFAAVHFDGVEVSLCGSIGRQGVVLDKVFLMPPQSKPFSPKIRLTTRTTGALKEEGYTYVQLVVISPPLGSNMARNKIDIADDGVKEDKENSNHGTDAGDSSKIHDSDSRYASTSQPEEDSCKVHPQYVPPISYSSSDEEEFYDADEELIDLDKTDDVAITDGPMRDMSFEKADNFDFGDSHEDFDEIYDNAEEHDVGNVQQEHGSVLVHLLSQVSIGMDLTKVTLPTFILERRSLLEMYADFFAHPDAFVATVDLETPQERFISVVRYYLNAFYAARKSGVAKKPYNPILGETFRCRYKLPDENSSYNLPNASPTGEKTDSGPFPGSDTNQLTFIAEQVSHHPPVSAFYAEHPAKRISFNAHIYTKSSFLGLSIGVANIGSGTVILHDFDERYTVTFPSGYGRSIMSTPWVELGGKVKITCEKTGFYADIDFLTKPFFGGKPHRIAGSLYKEGQKKPFMTIRGEWNNVMMAKPAWGDEYLFIDVKAHPEMKKECVPVMQQGERESRRTGRLLTKMGRAVPKWAELSLQSLSAFVFFLVNVFSARLDILDCMCPQRGPIIGNRDITSLGLSLFPMSSMLIDTPNTQNVCVKAVTTRIAKHFQGKQKPYEDPYLPKHPGGVNPITGEIGGPAGVEPTRYGDWERKGRHFSWSEILLAYLIFDRLLGFCDTLGNVEGYGMVPEVVNTPEIAVECAITDPRIVNVSEMLAQPSIQALQQSNPLLYKTLEVFAYGTVEDLPNEVNLPPTALSKLRQLSLITLAANSKSNRQLSYAEVMQFLRLNSVRELEDVVIDAIYNKFIKARLDSKGQFIEIDDWAPRDTPANTIPTIIITLNDFARRVVEVRKNADEDANRRDAQVVADRKRVQQAEAELAAARKALDESMMATMNSHEPSTSARSKPSRSARQRPSQATPTNKGRRAVHVQRKCWLVMSYLKLDEFLHWSHSHRQDQSEDVVSAFNNDATTSDATPEISVTSHDDEVLHITLNLNSCPICRKDMGRHIYDHLFTLHGFTRDDLEQAKKQRRRWKLLSSVGAPYICNVCNLQYKNRRGLLHHRKEKKHDIDDQVIRLILCPMCDKQVEDQEELMEHVDEEHAAALQTNYTLHMTTSKSDILPPEMNFGHVSCPECGKFFKREHIGEHAIFVHNYTNRERQILLLHLGVELTTPIPHLTFKCDHCSRSFGKKHDLSDHLTSKHTDKNPSTTTTGNAFACVFEGCGSSFNSIEEVVNHCARMHSMEAGQPFEIISASFDNMAEFRKWKSDMEKMTNATFCFRGRGDFHTAVYACATSSTSRDEIESQNKKARTLEQCCTAFIKCRPRSDGTVEAISCMDHVGHSRKTDVPLSDEQKAEVGELLSNGTAASEIVNILKQKYGSDPGICNITCSDIALLGEPSSDGQGSGFECDEGQMTPQKSHSDLLEACDDRIEGIRNDNDLYYSCEPCRRAEWPKVFFQTYHPNDSGENSHKTKFPLPESISCPKCRMVFKTKYQLAVHCVSFHGSFSSNAFIVQTSFVSWKQFQVIENEDGVLDCVAFFDHLGHDEKSVEGSEPATESEEDVEAEEVCYLCGNDVPPEVDAHTADYVAWIRCNVAECRSLAHEWCVELLGNKCAECENGLLVVKIRN
ncbi:hypothetical protein GCK32_002787, partial [Trichostrongylus colubriformis]